MRPGMAVSSVAHAVVLGWGLLTFAPHPLEAPQTEAMPIDLVSLDELTKTRQGKRDAPKVEEAKPQAEKVEEPKKAPDVEKRIENKPEIKPTAPPPPVPEEPKKEVKKEQPKSDPIKDLIVKDDAQEQARKQEKTPKKEPPKKVVEKQKQPPPVKQRNFNPDQIAALLDKREPQRQHSASEQMSPMASFGVNSGLDQRMSQNDIDALRAQIQACWNPPVGAENAQDLVVRIRVQFKKDGTLSAEPSVLNRGNSPYFQVAAESAMRAVRRCAPYTLPAAKYELWKDVEVTFDPRDMFRGG